MKKAMIVTLLVFLSAVLIPTKVQSQQGLPGEKLVLSIYNHLNYTRTNETVIIRWINLTEVEKKLEDANPDSFRLTDENENEVPSQFDDLTAYGYEKYLVFTATVTSNSSINYTLYYTTGTWSPPAYTKAVPITDMGTTYSFTTQNYSGMINKTSGVITSLKTSHSGELLNQSASARGRGFCDSQVFGSGWTPLALQVFLTGSQTTLLSEGPVRSIVVTKGALNMSEWNFTTISLLYKDRVETLTRQEYLGEGGAFRAVRISTIGSLTSWLEEATVSLDGMGEVFQETVQIDYTGYPSNPYHSWVGFLFSVRAKEYYESSGEIIGKWFDITSKNGSFGYGFIVHDAQDAVRIEVQDGRADQEECILCSFYQVSPDPSGGDTIVLPNTECWYHWTILPHDNTDHNYARTEAEKAYSPLGFKVTPPPPPPPPPPTWLIYAIFFAIVAVIAILFARKLKAKA